MTKNILIAVFIRKDYKKALNAFDDVSVEDLRNYSTRKIGRKKSSAKETLLNELQWIITLH